MDRFGASAVVLSTVDYGEADRVVTLLTRERGKLTAFAAGARKSKRRFAGALEPCTHLQVQLVERHGTTHRLDSAEIQRTFHSVREDLPRIARALYCVELCRELTRDQEPHPQLFDQLLAYLGQLDAGAAGPTSLLAFELDALAQAGLMPRFDACTVCDGPVGDAPRFDPEQGGAVCERCTLRARFGVPTPAAVIQALRALQEGARVPLPAAMRQSARDLLNLFISHQLGRRLKTADFMVQVGAD